MLSTEELLKLRYKVIADYPGNHVKVGSIYTYATGRHFVNGQYNLSLTTMELYPHLFRKLEWWEERDEKDMPEYIKMCSYVKPCTNNIENLELKKNQIIKPDKWGLNCFEISHWVFATSLSIPATPEEYEQYLSQQTNK